VTKIKLILLSTVIYSKIHHTQIRQSLLHQQHDILLRLFINVLIPTLNRRITLKCIFNK